MNYVKCPVVTKGTYTNLCIYEKYAHMNASYMEYLNKSEKMSNKELETKESNNTQSEYEIKSENLLLSEDEDDGTTGVSFHSDLVKLKITEILNSALNKILSAKNLQSALGFYNCGHSQRKWFNRTLTLMANKGYIEKVDVVRKKKKGTERCIKLLKPYTMEKAYSSFGTNNLIDKNNEKKDIVGEGGVLTDLPIEYQVYRLIALSGEKGITSNTIKNSLNGIGEKILTKILQRLLKPNKAKEDVIGINRIAEFVGKERHYRYFASGSFEKFIRESRSDINNDTYIDTMLLSTYNVKQKRNRKKKEEIENNNEINNSQMKNFENNTINDNSKENNIQNQENSNINTTSNMITEITDNLNNSENQLTNTETNKISKSRQHEDYDINKKKIKKKEIISLTAVRRRQYLLKKIEEKRIIEVNYILINEWTEHERKENEMSHTIDKKTILRLVKKLEDENKIKMFIVNVPTLIGDNIKKTLVLHPDVKIDGDEMKNFINSLRDSNVVNTANLKQKKIKVEKDIEVEDLESIRKRKDLNRIPKEKSEKSENNTNEMVIEKNKDKENDENSKNSDTGNKTDFDNTEKTEYIKNTVSSNNNDITENTEKTENTNTKNTENKVIDEIDENIENKTNSENNENAKSAENDEEKEDKNKEKMNEDNSENKENSNENAIAEVDIKIEENNNSSRKKENAIRQEKFWMSIAQKYGYISAKMIRAKIFHQYLFKILFKINNTNELDKNKKEYLLETAMLIRELPLELYLKLIGHLSPSTDLEEYIRIPENTQTNIIELPKKIRNILFSGKLRFRRNLRQLFEILIALGAIKSEVDSENKLSVDDEKKYNKFKTLNKSYTILTCVPLHDYGAREIPFIRNFNIHNMDELNNYWVQLQCVCQQRDPETYGNKIQREESNTQRTDNENTKIKKRKTICKAIYPTDHPLAFINNVRNWHNIVSCTISQRAFLNSYINKERKTTPYRNDILCREIANKLGLSEIKVKNYYRKHEDRFNEYSNDKHIRYKSQKVKGRRENIRKRRSDHLKNKDNINSYVTRGRPSFRDNQNSEVSNLKNILKRKEHDSTHQTRQDTSSLPVIGDEDRYHSQYENIIKRHRPNWTASEDEILIHAYVIGRHRTENTKSKFLWSPIASLIENRNNELCRRRMNVLLKNAYNQERIRQLSIKWRNIFNHELEKQKKLNEKSTSDNMSNNSNDENNEDEEILNLQLDKEFAELDLKRMVDFFIKRSNNDKRIEIVEKQIYLPEDIELLDKIYNIRNTLTSNMEGQLLLEDQLDELTSLRAKLYALYSVPLTLNIYNKSISDNYIDESRELEIDESESEKIKALIKMILMIPKEKYSSSQAFSVLNNFSQDEIINAIQKCKDDGTLVKVKGYTDRRVPGRGFHLSDKFLSILSGSLPEDLFEQACIFEENLKSSLKAIESLNMQNEMNKYVEFSPLSGGGSVASLLDLITSDEIELVPKFPENGQNMNEIDVLMKTKLKLKNSNNKRKVEDILSNNSKRVCYNNRNEHQSIANEIDMNVDKTLDENSIKENNKINKLLDDKNKNIISDKGSNVEDIENVEEEKTVKSNEKGKDETNTKININDEKNNASKNEKDTSEKKFNSDKISTNSNGIFEKNNNTNNENKNKTENKNNNMDGIIKEKNEKDIILTNNDILNIDNNHTNERKNEQTENEKMNDENNELEKNIISTTNKNIANENDEGTNKKQNEQVENEKKNNENDKMEKTIDKNTLTNNKIIINNEQTNKKQNENERMNIEDNEIEKDKNKNTPTNNDTTIENDDSTNKKQNEKTENEKMNIENDDSSNKKQNEKTENEKMNIENDDSTNKKQNEKTENEKMDIENDDSTYKKQNEKTENEKMNIENDEMEKNVEINIPTNDDNIIRRNEHTNEKQNENDRIDAEDAEIEKNVDTNSSTKKDITIENDEMEKNIDKNIQTNDDIVINKNEHTYEKQNENERMDIENDEDAEIEKNIDINSSTNKDTTIENDDSIYKKQNEKTENEKKNNKNDEMENTIDRNTPANNINAIDNENANEKQNENERMNIENVEIEKNYDKNTPTDVENISKNNQNENQNKQNKNNENNIIEKNNDKNEIMLKEREIHEENNNYPKLLENERKCNENNENKSNGDNTNENILINDKVENSILKDKNGDNNKKINDSDAEKQNQDKNQEIINNNKKYNDKGDIEEINNDKIKIKELLNENFKNDTKFSIQIIEKIYSCIENSKEKGVTINKIKYQLNNIENILESDLNIVLRKLTKCYIRKEQNLPIVISAGFRVLRYVSYKYIESWVLPLKKTNINEEGKIVPQYAPFRMWYDLDGNVVESIKRNCLEAVLGVIIQKPGIYESRLYKKFSVSMSKCELRELLDMLMEKKAIKCKRIVKPKKPSIFDFDDNNNFENYDNKSFNMKKITCYFANNGWYKI